MGVFEIILIICCTAIVLGVITKAIINKKNGKTNCDCCNGNCSHCAYKKQHKK